MLKSFFKIFIKIILYLPKKIIRKENIIVISGHDYYSYSGNSRFLYEYLSRNTDFEIYWFTDNEHLKTYLKSLNFRYISTKNIIKTIWVLLKTKVVINSGDSYINMFSILDNKNVYKISLTHGFGPKTDNLKLDNNSIDAIHKFDFINFPSEYTCENNGIKLYKLPKDKIISLGYPKNDVLQDEQQSAYLYKKKPIINMLFPDIDHTEATIILYTPTWRPYQSELPLTEIDGYTKEKFLTLLNNKNILFIYSLHPTNPPKNTFNDNRVSYINNNQTFGDINQLRHETDILMNDYSTTSVDYSITKKPQMFCLPDHENYIKHINIEKNYHKSIPGDSFNDFDGLKNIIDEILDSNEKYVDKYKKNNREYLNKYYDIYIRNSSERFKFFIEQLMTNK